LTTTASTTTSSALEDEPYRRLRLGVRSRQLRTAHDCGRKGNLMAASYFDGTPHTAACALTDSCKAPGAQHPEPSAAMSCGGRFLLGSSCLRPAMPDWPLVGLDNGGGPRVPDGAEEAPRLQLERQ
jgi:hypothetical protein